MLASGEARKGKQSKVNKLLKSHDGTLWLLTARINSSWKAEKKGIIVNYYRNTIKL